MKKATLSALFAIALGAPFLRFDKASEVKDMPEFAPEGMVAYAASYSDSATSEPKWTTQNNTTFKYLNLGSTLDEYRGDSVKVGIIDSGINYDHEDFMVNSSTKVQGQSKYYAYQATGWVYYGAASHGYNYIDDTLGHGTNVAATVAAAINGVGGLGLAPNVELYVYKVTNANDGYEFGAIQNALLNAKSLGLDVVNMSFQSYENAVTYNGHTMAASSGCSSVLTYYLNQAYNAGITLVGAAGNYDTNEPSYPGSNNHVINVGSLNSSGTDKAAFSNYGSTIDLVAPGYVYVADESSNTAYTNTQGTSFSAPLVTAAIALYKQRHPDATPAQIEEALYESCDPIVGTNWAGHGKLNVAKFVGVESGSLPQEIVVNNPEIVEGEVELSVGDTLNLDWTVTGEGNFDETVHFEVTCDPEGVLSVSDKGKITAIAEGYAIVDIISNVDPSVNVSVWVNVQSSGSAPTVSSVEINPSDVDLDLNGIKSANLSATVYGANNPSQTVTWVSEDPNVATVSNSGVVTGVSEGSTTIKAISTVDSTKYGTCTVDVVDSSPPIHREVIEKTEETGTITFPNESTISIVGTKVLSTTKVANCYYESTSMRLGTGSGGGDLKLKTTSGVIESVRVTCKAYSDSRKGNLSIGDKTIYVSNTNYQQFDLVELDSPSDEIHLTTPSSSVRINVQQIIVNLCVTEEDIGLTEDCVGLEDFISEYMHMDYVQELGWCSDLTHHYYSSAKSAFNGLNNHQRSLFTKNDAYSSEWARLKAWAAANGESLNTETILLSANASVSHLSQQQDSTVLIIVVVSVLATLSTATLLVIKKRKITR